MWRLALVGLRRLRPVTREIESVRPLEAVGGRLGGHDSRDAVCADLAVHRGDHVPGAGLQNEAQRFEETTCRTLAPVVVDGDPGRAPDRVGQRAEVWHRLTPVEPLPGVEMEALDQARG